jgi:transcription antitermination factor NusG
MSIIPLTSKTVLQWYVAYVFPKAEKKVQGRLQKMGIESYLPMHKVIRHRSDRMKTLIVPLFPNYLFVHTFDSLRIESFGIKEIVRYVSFNGKVAVVNDSVINNCNPF